MTNNSEAQLFVIGPIVITLVCFFISWRYIDKNIYDTRKLKLKLRREDSIFDIAKKFLFALFIAIGPAIVFSILLFLINVIQTILERPKFMG